jgi:hypothetical protein
MKRTVSFYFIDYYYRPLTGVHWDKRYVFLVNMCAFFGRCIESMRTDPSYPTIYFLPVPPSPHHVLAWFRTRGVGAPLSWLSLAARRACRYHM